MALTVSNSFQPNKEAPEFTLLNTVTLKMNSLQELKGEKGTVILFICNHCPYVIHINEALVKIANNYQTKGINFIAISSNDIDHYPQDSPKKMKELAENLNYPFPYLYDETQEIAKSYDAACTPDIFLFDKELRIYYHGQFDNSRPGNKISVTGKELTGAMNLLLKNKSFEGTETPSIGCGIKWK